MFDLDKWAPYFVRDSVLVLDSAVLDYLAIVSSLCSNASSMMFCFTSLDSWLQRAAKTPIGPLSSGVLVVDVKVGAVTLCCYVMCKSHSIPIYVCMCLF